MPWHIMITMLHTRSFEIWLMQENPSEDERNVHNEHLVYTITNITPIY